MKLKEYIAGLNAFVKENPKARNFDVIYSRDDEGNGFQGVYFSPTLGQWDGDYEFDDAGTKPNAVCIN